MRAGEFADPVPEEWRTSLELWGRTESFEAIHRPESFEAKDRAHRRLVFDELFRLQLALVLRRRAFEVNARALRHDVSPREVTGNVSDTLVARFLAGLPYELTTAQRRALAVIVADMAGPFPMHRLLQGDVGSGKTVVALAALLAAVQSGHQGALDGADRGAGRAALHGRPRAARRPRGPRRHDRRPRPGRAAHQQGEGQGPRRRPRGPGLGCHRCRRRHPRVVDRGGGVPLPRLRRDRRAASLRRGAAGHPARQGDRRRPRPVGHDGDAHPAHGRHGDLRRPRPHHARRAPARSGAHHDEWLPGAGEARRGLGPRAQRGRPGPPGLRRLPLGERIAPGGGEVGQGGVRAAVGQRAVRPPGRAMHGQMATARPEKR